MAAARSSQLIPWERFLTLALLRPQESQDVIIAGWTGVDALLQMVEQDQIHAWLSQA